MLVANLLPLLAGIAYIVPFVANQYCWWLILFFPCLVLCAIAMHQYAWWQIFGSAWICIGLQQCGLIVSLYRMTSGPWYVRLVPGISVISYCSFIFFCVWVVVHWGMRIVFLHDRCVVRIIAAATSYMGALLVIDRYGFIVCGSYQGYPFLNPILLLAQLPELLWPVAYCGVDGASLYFWLVSALGVIACVHHNKRCIVLAIACVLIWIAGACLVSSESLPDFLDHIMVLDRRYSATNNLDIALRLLQSDIRDVQSTHPQVQLIIMPESALSVGMIDEIYSGSIYCSCALLAGGYRMVDTSSYNTVVYAVHAYAALFSKRLLVPIVERIPYCLSYTWLQSLFFKHSPILSESNNKRWVCTGNPCTFVPYICSELFLSSDPDDEHPDDVIIACVNDTWCVWEYVRQCMQLCARLRAIAWNRAIIYASYHAACYISKNGREYPLAIA